MRPAQTPLRLDPAATSDQQGPSIRSQQYPSQRQSAHGKGLSQNRPLKERPAEEKPPETPTDRESQYEGALEHQPHNYPESHGEKLATIHPKSPTQIPN